MLVLGITLAFLALATSLIREESQFSCLGALKIILSHFCENVYSVVKAMLSAKAAAEIFFRLPCFFNRSFERINLVASRLLY